jgi:diguanylate cyclase (GGDEF)-like protein/hemerythrin-like metal-binding protein
VQAFEWDASFDTHLQDVDTQHHRLVDLINALGEAIAGQDDLAELELRRLHRELADYAALHFSDEERLMRESGVDERHASRHRREHEDFRGHVAELGSLGGEAPAARGRRILSYLVSWLAYHILGFDQALSRQINAIRGGRTPGAAFDQEAEPPDAASRLLLHSVGTLFDVLSARNRELVDLTRHLEQRVAERTRELSELLAKVEQMAMTDFLTGLPNRRYAMVRLAGAWSAAMRHGRDLGCLVIDADGFKQVNDTCGHDAGDRVLVRVAAAIRAAVRESDEVCRLGGDEFLVLCPETSLEGALIAGERVRAALAGLRVEVPGGAWDGSVSVGVSAAQPWMAGPEELLRAADAGTYEAKRLGRNAVAVAPAIDVPRRS